MQLKEPIQRALELAGYQHPTPIQTQAIPLATDRNDLLACAQTGTGKTAAFALPILQMMGQVSKGKPQALILAPTRELAIQIGDSFAAYGKYLPYRHLVIFGGVNQSTQVRKLQKGVDIIVATPGRLLDLMQQGFVHLDAIEWLVLDEADRMLDMGFIHDMRKIIRELPKDRQTFFFSATLPKNILQLSKEILRNPAKVEVAPNSSTAERVNQSVYFVAKNKKRSLLLHVLRQDGVDEALVFTRTKHGANKVVKELGKKGIQAEAIHGNKSQNARQQALRNFKARKTRVLVATDIAARGIDIDELSHVINFDLPNVSETYVHRIGRTGRAGASGLALSFCDTEEKAYLRDIEKLIGKRIDVIEEHPFLPGPDDEQYHNPPKTNSNGKGRGPYKGKNHRRKSGGRGRPQRGNNR